MIISVIINRSINVISAVLLMGLSSLKINMFIHMLINM